MEINYIDQRPEISIVDDTVILSLTLQDNAASTAINAANEAEASALAAGLSEQNAFDSEQAAAQSESNAAGSATAASQSASNALASEQNAAQSETNAATSASTATTQAGIATTKATEASQSASEALASAQAAAQSEVDAEAARNEIVSKIDFTGAQEGDIYRVNSAGVAVRINETEFLKSKVPFGKSVIGTDTILRGVSFWDNFNRPSADVFQSDSGINWESFNGSTASINSRGLLSTSGIIRIPTAGVLRFPTSATIGNGHRVTINSGDVSIFFFLYYFIDDTNYFKIGIEFGRRFQIYEIVNSVETKIHEQDVQSRDWLPETIDFYMRQNNVDCVRSSIPSIRLTSTLFKIENYAWTHIGFSGTMNSIKITQLTY